MFVTAAISGRRERDRAVGLVAFDDEPALPHAGVPAELRDDPADDPRRIVTELAQDVRDHRRRRRLAVRAADDDRRAERDELREELGARATLDPARVRGRDDDLEAVRRGRLAADVDVDVRDGLEEDRVARVPAAHLRAPGPREVRVRGETGAADPDEVEAAAGERELAHRRASASATSSSAMTSAASGFARVAHRLAHAREPPVVAEQLLRQRGHAERARV